MSEDISAQPKPQSTIKPPLGDLVALPNSKLSPELQAMVRTDEFTEWFGDWQNDPNAATTSKIVDPDTGEPQVFYHGTNRDFELEDIRKPAVGDLSNFGLSHDYEGIFLTESHDLAKQYADPLGNEFRQILMHVARHGENGSWLDAFEKWNDLMTACQQRDPRVSVADFDSDEKGINLEQFDQNIAAGKAKFDQVVKLDGEVIMPVGEFLQFIGGKFPKSEDDLVAYESLHSDAQQMLDAYAKRGGKLLIPEYATTRIIPVFVKSLKPVRVDIDNPTHVGMVVDHAFADGFDQIKANPEAGYDSVVVGGSKTPFGTNIAILHAEQLREALSVN